MDTYMHKTMVSVASLGKIEIIRSQEFMPSGARLKFLKKIIILGPKTAFLGPQFCRILVLGPHFWWSGGLGPPLDLPLREKPTAYFSNKEKELFNSQLLEAIINDEGQRITHDKY